MITEPIHRYERIGNIIESFTKAELLDEWQMKVQSGFAQIRAKQLYHAKVLDPRNSNLRNWDEYENKKFPHTQPLKLDNNQWAVVYTNRDTDGANTLVDMMRRA